ncbi:MAG: carboxymuconolactone decarboxylase family protein [Dehalococcoidales bacterium]|jgi:alkylhydroperoxidase/carboxymuconolactone decarboxylase family protein YurZ|nr:carboxymuconolactone decarboxylase family protein [Dehalococcoidales bacterium]
MTASLNWHEVLQNNLPDLMKSVNEIRKCTTSDGALTSETKTLMTLLGDMILGHAEGVASIARQARIDGISDEAIKETIEVAYLMGGLPALITGANAFRN